MRKAKPTIKYGAYNAMSVLFITVSVLLMVATFIMFSNAKYVTEVNKSEDIVYDLQNPFKVKNQQELFNAIVSGYNYVRIEEGLESPIVMTGDALDLKADLTIDLNGNEIQRNNRDSLLKVTDGNTFTVVDTAGGRSL